MAHTLTIRTLPLALIELGAKKVVEMIGRPRRYESWVGKTLDLRPTDGPADGPTGGGPTVRVMVTAARHYRTLEAFIAAEWRAALPHMRTKGDARLAYQGTYRDNGRPAFSEERVAAAGGVWAIEVKYS